MTANRLVARAIFFLLGVLFLPGCLLLHRHRQKDLAAPVNPSDQPDKILYERAVNEITHGRFDVGRLTLQTLMNTYPDSEFLSKGKLAIADSYYQEGGVTGLTQAEAEYKDFITFFPTAPEAPEAQYRAGMAHFRMMSKADRDLTEARLAETEFKEFLLKYPDSTLMARVKARLREVQEVLGQGEFKVAKFYYLKGANRAARSRFQEIASRYPSFSQGDEALWYLGQTLERLKKPNEAIPYYSRILSDFPLSPYGSDAKARLVAMHQPIPRPTHAMLARAEADAAHRANRDILSKFGGALSGAPDTSATLRGPVHLGAPVAGPVEVAKTPASTGPAVTNTIVVQPLGDASLSGGEAAGPKPATGDAQKAHDSQESSGASKGQASATGSENNQQPDSSSPAKKKGKFHRLKKLLKPF